MEGEREVGGMRCSEVLAELSDYLDGVLAEARRKQIELHVAGCDTCEQFGGSFKSVIAGVRAALRRPVEPLGPELVEAIKRRAREEG